MNGLSDVRLTLHSQELAKGQENGTREANMRNAPSGLSRWDLFWHRAESGAGAGGGAQTVLADLRCALFSSASSRASLAPTGMESIT